MFCLVYGQRWITHRAKSDKHVLFVEINGLLPNNYEGIELQMSE